MEIYGPRSTKMSNNEKRLEAAIIGFNLPFLNGIGQSHLFAVEQVEMMNHRYPDWSYFVDFQLCMVTADRYGAVYSYLFVEADDNYYHVRNRAKDYRRDIDLLWWAPTLRFDSERIYREPLECINEAVMTLYNRHEDQYRAINQSWLAEYERAEVAAEVRALRKSIHSLHSNVNDLLKKLGGIAFQLGRESTFFDEEQENQKPS